MKVKVVQDSRGKCGINGCTVELVQTEATIGPAA